MFREGRGETLGGEPEQEQAASSSSSKRGRGSGTRGRLCCGKIGLKQTCLHWRWRR